MKLTVQAFALTALCFFAHISSYAQNKAPLCGWNKAMENANLGATGLKSQMRAAQNKLQSMLRQVQVLDADSLYTLPIVVHVIHTGTAIGSADNPTDANIIAMIGGLNDAWRKNGVTFGGVDMK